MREFVDYLRLYINLRKSRKADFEVSQLAKWVLIILSVIVILFLIRGWVNRGIDLNPFRR